MPPGLSPAEPAFALKRGQHDMLIIYVDADACPTSSKGCIALRAMRYTMPS